MDIKLVPDPNNIVSNSIIHILNMLDEEYSFKQDPVEKVYVNYIREFYEKMYYISFQDKNIFWYIFDNTIEPDYLKTCFYRKKDQNKSMTLYISLINSIKIFLQL